MLYSQKAPHFKDPAQALALKVIHRAVEDWKLCQRDRSGRAKRDYYYLEIEAFIRTMGFSGLEEDLTVFFNGEEFDLWCHAAGFHPDHLRRERPDLPWQNN